MKNCINRGVALAFLGCGATAIIVSHAYAAGPYDGTWVVDSPAVGRATSDPTAAYCPPVHALAIVNNNVITGDFFASPDETPAQAAAIVGRPPITGTVDADGTVTARILSIQITGKATPNSVELKWTGECGPRTGVGKRAS